MPIPIKAFAILLAGLVTLSLALVVLIGDPTNPQDFLAWAGIATAAAMIVYVWPERTV